MDQPSDDFTKRLVAETAGPYDLRIARVIRETLDAVSIIFEVPRHLTHVFRYRAGQFVTLKIPYEGKELSRCYSLSSSPDCECEHKVTVKRVSQGRISNWLNENSRPGNTLKVLPPGGSFTLDDTTSPLVFFAGGSGITPVISLIKSALVTTDRLVRLIYANHDRPSIIFRMELDELAAAHSDRVQVVHHLDVDSSFLDAAGAARLVNDRLSAEFYVCGPGAFMDTVENALLGLRVDGARLHFERFVSPPDPPTGTHMNGPVESSPSAMQSPETISVYLDGRVHELRYEEGRTILATVQRAGLEPPFSCTEGFCGCCMAKLRSGRVRMIKNDFLSERELREGWVLTCQSVPESNVCNVEYPD